ncbi:hypothetical protein [Teredinibacter purpureus]|uniref:hypothetical protein n=1 Tax=Teredinibacter purpureus TaxID=2731756 RepID=UPI0005F82DE4|nr:hypothetical protein [Teredinibacter purpureus]
MLKNVTGEVSITWGDKTINKTLSGALIQLALAASITVLFTSIIAFVILGISLLGFLALFIISAAGIGAACYFGRDFLTGLLFKGAHISQTVPAEAPSSDIQSTESDSGAPSDPEVKA